MLRSSIQPPLRGNALGVPNSERDAAYAGSPYPRAAGSVDGLGARFTVGVRSVLQRLGRDTLLPRVMPRSRVVLFTAPADQGDILQDFLDWHLDLGVDFIIALDHGSTDGSTELLERYSKTHPVSWFPIQERDITKYSPADELAALARDKYGADWIIHCDADEFLCTSGHDLRSLLDRAEGDGVTLIDVPRRNVTG